MSPLFMATGYEPNSPSSLSAEESHSNNAGSEREGDEQQMGKRGKKRQVKNREAARKSRRKQTERADELHEELQCLEQSNSAFHKEIAMLKKDLQLYTTALDRHKPFCCLRDSTPSSSSTTHLMVSPSADCQTSPRLPGVPPRAPTSTQAAAPSLSTSSTSSLGLQTLDCVCSTHLSSSTPAPTSTTLASSTGSSSELFTSSSSISVPYSGSFSTVLTLHSLFSSDPRPANIMPVCTSLVASPLTSSSLTTAAQPQSRQGAIHESSSMPAMDALLMKQASVRTASSKVVPPYSHLVTENTGLVAQGCPMNVSQPHQGHFRGNPVNSSPPCSLLPSTLQDPALQSFSVAPQANPEPSPASAFASKPGCSRHVTPNMLSLLTVPSPLDVSQTTSSIFDPPLPQPQLLGDPSIDISLSEFLEFNDWILQ